MKKLINRIIGIIFSIHVVTGYISGFTFIRFDTFPYYIVITIPIFLLLVIFFLQWDVERQEHDPNILVKHSIATLKNVWFWCLMLLSLFFVIRIMYYTGQLLLPIEKISRKVLFNNNPYQGIILCITVLSVMYIYCLIWIRKTLLLIWK